MFRRKKQKGTGKFMMKRNQIIKGEKLTHMKKILALFLVVFMIMGVTMSNSSIYAKGSMNYLQQEKTDEISDRIRNIEKTIKSDVSNSVMPVAADYWKGWDINADPNMWRTDDANGILIIEKGGTIIIDGSGSSTEVMNTIRINTDDRVYLTINNLQIGTDRNAPIDIQSGIVFLELRGDNTLHVWDGSFPSIAVSELSDLYIDGDGILVGNRISSLVDYADCGAITIDGGTIDMTMGGSENAAAIGGSQNSHTYGITINGGTINAGSHNGAGIGSGKNGSVSEIRINGGTIKCGSNGKGAGIGSGLDGSVDKIIINGGNIHAVGFDGAGIGGGEASTSGSVKVKSIIIAGGNVSAVSRQYGAGIGGGKNGTADSIAITGGTIAASSGGSPSSQTADIGGGFGFQDTMGDFWISGGSIYTYSKKMSTVPLNSDTNRTPMFCGELQNQSGTKNIKVDGVDYKIDGNQEGYLNIPASDSFYLYMTGGKNHIVTVTDASDKIIHYEAVWNKSRESFTISDDRIAGDFIVDGGTKGAEWRYEIDSNTLYIVENGNYKIYSCVDKTKQRIQIYSNVQSTVTINDLYIETTNSPGILLGDNTDLKLSLVGVNRVDASKCTNGAPGIYVWPKSTIEISGDGTLICTSKGGAGIGGAGDDVDATNGSITINSGTIQAKSESGAGIGSGDATKIGGDTSLGHNIIINGGTVTAESVSGAGIGGGNGARAENITVNGGNVSAKSTNGAGIGGGSGQFGADISFNGGTITAKSTNGDGVGAGVNNKNTCTNIFVNRASVWATGKKPFSIQVSNSALDEVELYKLKNQTATSHLTVDETAYSLGGAHPGDSNYYLYLTKAEHTIVSDAKTDNIKWYENDGMFKFKSPLPSVSVSETKVDSVLVGGSSATSLYGDIEYSLDGNTWQSEGNFDRLKASTSYTVYARYSGKGEYGASDSTTVSATTQNPSYTITIPSSLTVDGAAENITTGGSQFSVGYGGQVNVKVGSGMSSTGIMTLTRTLGTVKPTISTQFKVNGADFTNTSTNVATLKKYGDAVPISFVNPTSALGSIPAGTYSGIVVFVVSYTQ